MHWSRKRNRARARVPIRRVLAAILFCLLLAGCTAPVLTPQGYFSDRIHDMWQLMFPISIVVFVVVLLTLFYALFRQRRPGEGENLRAGRTMVLFGGAILPGIVMIILMVEVVAILVDVSLIGGQLERQGENRGLIGQPNVAEPEAEVADLVVDVIGRHWWWEVIYPNQGIVTANEIHMPEDALVLVRLTSDGVMHSFWVPALNGKTDMLPGSISNTWLHGYYTDAYRGQCAEYCGIGHAKMRLLTITQTEEDLEVYLSREAEPAPEPTTEETIRGQAVFVEQGCAACHAIRGLSDAGEIGPDLTHLLSRREIAAGTLVNTRGNRAGWIVDSQSIKPGNMMPPFPMPPSDLQALLAYLDTLE